MPFLRGTTLIWGPQDLQHRFKEWKACLVEMGEEKYAHADTFVAHCCFQAQYGDKFKHLDRSPENVLKVVSVLCVARTPSKGTTNGGN